MVPQKKNAYDDMISNMKHLLAYGVHKICIILKRKHVLNDRLGDQNHGLVAMVGLPTS